MPRAIPLGPQLCQWSCLDSGGFFSIFSVLRGRGSSLLARARGASPIEEPHWSPMNPEQLKALQIKPDAKKRPERSVWIIFIGVALVTVVGAYYAWPKKQEERRLLEGHKQRA